MGRVAAVFPSEGSQSMGMGRDFYAKSLVARKYYDDAERILSVKLMKVCFLGTKEELDLITNAHLATFVSDVAFFETLIQNKRKSEMVTGAGVGEIAALVWAECLPFTSALPWIYKRAQLLEKWAATHSGYSLSIAGLKQEQLEPLLNREGGDLVITHYYAPDFFVVWGGRDAVESLQSELQGVPQVKSTLLPNRPPLFTPQAAELEPEIEKILDTCLVEEKTELKSPKLMVFSSSLGSYVGTLEAVREILVKQYSRPVRWTETVQAAALQGFRTWVEVGPGKTYTTMVKKIDPNTRVTNVEDIKSLTTALKIIAS